MHTQAIIHAIENHSILQIAGFQNEQYQIAVRERLLQVNGMLEVVQRMDSIDPILLRFLKAHKEQLAEKITGQ